MGLIYIAARTGAREINRPKPAGQKPKPWPWQVRLIWLGVFIGVAVQFPVGRAILIAVGGLLVACVIAVLAMGFSAAGSASGRKGPFEQYMEEQEQQEGSKR